MAVHKSDMVRDIAEYLRQRGIVVTQAAISRAFPGEFLSHNSRALFGIWSNMDKKGYKWVVDKLNEHDMQIPTPAPEILAPEVPTATIRSTALLAHISPPPVTGSICLQCGYNDPGYGDICPNCEEPKEGRKIMPRRLPDEGDYICD